jgi:hypothetical protein
MYTNILYCFYLTYDKSSYSQSVAFQCVDYGVFSEIPVPFLIVHWQKD